MGGVDAAGTEARAGREAQPPGSRGPDRAVARGRPKSLRDQMVAFSFLVLKSLV